MHRQFRDAIEMTNPGALEEEVNFRWSQIARLVGYLIVISALLSVTAITVFARSPISNSDLVSIERFEIAKLDSYSVEELFAADYFEVARQKRGGGRFANSYRLDRGYYAFRSTFDLGSVPPQGLALIDPNTADNRIIYANGQIVLAQGQMDLASLGNYQYVEAVVRIPAASLKAGKNSVEIIKAYGTPRTALIRKPFVGSYDVIKTTLKVKEFFAYEGRMIATAIGLFMSFFALVALAKAVNRTMHFWLLLVILSWSMVSLFSVWTAIPLYGATRELAHTLVALCASAFWLPFVNAWTGGGKKWPMLVTALFLPLAFLLLLIQHRLLSPGWEQNDLYRALTIFGLVFGLLAFTRMIAHVATRREPRLLEASLLTGIVLVITTVSGIYLYAGVIVLDINQAQTVFIAGFVTVFFVRNIRLFQSSAQINELLATKLQAREAQLEIAHEREKQLIKNEALLAERQRIMRDMHDGFGSGLMSMLFAVRNGEKDTSRLGNRIENLIDEMRLMIASMDSVGDSLVAALGTFRKRTQSRMKDTPIDFRWDDRSTNELPQLGPKASLQVFRILQEAVTNALKHSQGDQISVILEQIPPKQNGLVITIEDNGKGMPAQPSAGYGLENMHSRAKIIGADIHIVSEAGEGCQVVLQIGPDQT